MPYHYVVRNVNNEIIGTRKSKGRLYQFAVTEGQPAGSVWTYSATYKNAMVRAEAWQRVANARGERRYFNVVEVNPVSAEEFKAAKKEYDS